MTYQIKAACPECGYAVDDAAGIGDAEGDHPEPGNYGICLRCAGVGVYKENDDGTLGLRLTTAEEKVELSEDEEVTKVRAHIRTQSLWWYQE